MKPINLNFSGVKNFGGKLTKNLGWIFFSLFLLLLAFEIFELNTSVQIFLSSNQDQPAPINKDKGVRINFNNYDKVVNKIQTGATFTPTDGVTKDPFQVSH